MIGAVFLLTPRGFFFFFAFSIWDQYQNCKIRLVMQSRLPSSLVTWKAWILFNKNSVANILCSQYIKCVCVCTVYCTNDSMYQLGLYFWQACLYWSLLAWREDSFGDFKICIYSESKRMAWNKETERCKVVHATGWLRQSLSYTELPYESISYLTGQKEEQVFICPPLSLCGRLLV